MRIDATREPHPSWAVATTIVQDDPGELAILRRPGDRVRIRNAEFDGPPGFRHRHVARWTGGWREDTWKYFRVLLLRRPEDHHSISLFWRDGGDDIEFYYIDLVSPLRRTTIGFDYVEHGLDVVVQPDLSSWSWKDADELEWSVEQGLFTKEERDAMYAEGERAVQRLVNERDRFERWRDWRPDPSWPIASLPAGWDPAPFI